MPQLPDSRRSVAWRCGTTRRPKACRSPRLTGLVRPTAARPMASCLASAAVCGQVASQRPLPHAPRPLTSRMLPMARAHRRHSRQPIGRPLTLALRRPRPRQPQLSRQDVRSRCRAARRAGLGGATQCLGTWATEAEAMVRASRPRRLDPRGALPRRGARPPRWIAPRRRQWRPGRRGYVPTWKWPQLWQLVLGPGRPRCRRMAEAGPL